MSEPVRSNGNAYSVADPAEFSRNMMKVAAQSQRLITDFVKNQSQQKSNGPSDPLGLSQTFVDFLGHAMRNPGKLVEANFKLWQSYLTLWHHTTELQLADPPVVDSGVVTRIVIPASQAVDQYQVLRAGVPLAAG